MICGGGGDLKCAANSNQNNGLEVYSRFLQTVADFQDLGSLPTSVIQKFNEEHNAEIFLKNEAKWYKTCHLKFAPSKLLRLQKRKLSCESVSEQHQRKSKRQKTSCNPDQESCIFCSEVSGTLHNCATMRLDHDIRKMATELQDSLLLARISGGDLITIEAKYHLNCLSTFKNKYRSAQRSQNNLTIINQEDELIQAQVFADLISYIEESIEGGNFIFKLSELHSMYVSQLEELGIEKCIHKTRLKLQILDQFVGDCQEQLSDGKSIVLVFNQGMKQMLKEAVDSHDFESEALVMVKLVKILRNCGLLFEGFLSNQNTTRSSSHCSSIGEVAT